MCSSPINPHSTTLVPTGIACAVSNDYYLQVEERGSTGSKGIKKSAGVIDSGYRDEIFIALTNINPYPIYIVKESYKSVNADLFLDNGAFANGKVYPYEKAIAQLVVHEVPKMEVKEISFEELQEIPSERGMGKLGSSDK